MQSYFEEMLGATKVQVDHASNSSEAVKLLGQKQYDLSFFDYRLGASTGLELFQKVRAEGVRTPIVFLTGQGGEEVAAEVIKAGSTDYLSKSKLNSNTLLQKVKNALEFRRTEDLRIGAEERLQNSERQFRALFDNSLDGIFIMDGNARFIDANAMACSLIGIGKEQLLGKTPADFAAPPYDFSQRWLKFLEKGRTHAEFSLLRPDGFVRDLEISARANFLPGKHLAIARDITEKKLAAQNHLKLEHQFRQAQKMEAIGHLAGGIAHDFNNLADGDYQPRGIAGAKASRDAVDPFNCFHDY